MRGRPPGIAPDQHRAFAALWRDPQFPVADLCARFGICEATAHATARRLRLPLRATIRRRAGMTEHGPLKLLHLGPVPSSWRCECGGRADSPFGHAACRASHAA